MKIEEYVIRIRKNNLSNINKEVIHGKSNDPYNKRTKEKID